MYNSSICINQRGRNFCDLSECSACLVSVRGLVSGNRAGWQVLVLVLACFGAKCLLGLAPGPSGVWHEGNKEIK